MAVMLSKLYAALKAAGAPDDIAREAAEQGASLDERMQRVEVKLTRVAPILVVVAGAVLAFWCGSIGRNGCQAPRMTTSRETQPHDHRPTQGGLPENAVDMTLPPPAASVGDANASPTCPPRPRQPAFDVA
jgi:hypothetical protein